MTKKHILITDTAPLYPPQWGGPRRIWNLYSNLSEELFEVTYVGVDCNINGNFQYKFQKIKDNFQEILCARTPHYHFWKIFKTAVSQDNALDLFFYLWMHTDWQFKYALNAIKSDVVICSHPWSSLCIDKKKHQIFIYDAHNCEYLLMRQILKNGIFKQGILKRVRNIENDACKKSDIILVCSENEKSDFIDLYKLKGEKVFVVPNGTNAENNKIIKTEGSIPKEKNIIFIGAHYKPNNEAAKFIIEKLAGELKDFTFLIVGTVSLAFNQAQIPENVKLMGFLPDDKLMEVCSESTLAINPMFSGSGSNIKMLDYMACGLAIVTTECGARGIETYGMHPMIISRIDEFCENIRKLNSDVELRQKLSVDGKELVSKYYNWKSISQRLEGIILDEISNKENA